MFNLILLGDPAAGKGTQSAHLVKKYKLVDVETGKELRLLASTDTPTARRLHKTLDKGKLAPTDIVQGIWIDKIRNTPQDQGLLFNGNPRMLQEAKFLSRELKKAGRNKVIAIYLSIPVSETVKRLRHRKEKLHGKLVTRKDDDLSGIKARVAFTKYNTAASSKFLQTKYPFKKVSGVGTRQEVKKRMALALKSLISALEKG